jgi:hypothetical protein
MASGDSLSAAQMFPIGSTGYTGSTLSQWPLGGQAASNNSIPSVSGAANPDYWLPIWSGEVINAYDQYNMFEPMVTTETIESGTTKRFPITGTVGHKGIWQAGEELVGNSGISTPGWFDISLDQRPMAAFFELDDIHLMLTQWDYRSELARQAGLQLSYIRDKQIACMIAQAAFLPNRNPFNTDYTGMNRPAAAGGTPTLPPNAAFNHLGNRASTQTQRTDAALLLLDYLERYMVRLSEIDATLGEVYCAVTPQAFHDIRALGIARDATGLVGGAGRPFFGGVAEAGGLGAPLTQGMFGITESLEYMGIKIVKSNHLQQLQGYVVKSGANTNTDRAPAFAATGLINNAADQVGILASLGDQKYNFDWNANKQENWDPTANNGAFTKDAISGASVAIAHAQGNDFAPIKALIWQRSAVCSLRLQGMKVETVKDVRRGTFFTVSSIMAGAGILRPELCGAIQGLEVN